MTANKVTPRQPVSYSGTGSAIDNYLKNQSAPEPKQPVTNSRANWGLFDKYNQQHMYLMSLLHQSGWTKEWEGKQVPDVMRLSDFLKSDKSPVKKPLKKMEPEEVSKIIVAFGGIVESKHSK